MKEIVKLAKWIWSAPDELFWIILAGFIGWLFGLFCMFETFREAIKNL